MIRNTGYVITYITLIATCAMNTVVHGMHFAKSRYAIKKPHQKHTTRIAKRPMIDCHVRCAYEFLKPHRTAAELEAQLERCCQSAEVAEFLVPHLVRDGDSAKLNVALQYHTPEMTAFDSFTGFAQFSYMQSEDPKYKEIMNLLHDQRSKLVRHNQAHQLVLSFLTRDRKDQ